ncbi:MULTISPECIES: glutamyl aminopeptidase [Enterococcaceae]|uniref:glutamyl aminopeptidase n=1 Tax=Enterococcaceae TaxID=81852 RepID=UPI000E543983|nr:MULTISPECIES: glutamyl aminopeptidase [Enterococcaceae]MCI0130412.1 glutamyl aminopeptidase [Vagococcus sp. CY53-2]RGI32142.1 glutamyl aminopeptidase [Melissococcus sp. OM08-11BH]UNM89847.1 glutamyl aminopeptidase [Vagococcus sp. CY52-2]
MDDKLFNRIKTLTEIQSVSGFEDNMRRVMAKEMTPFVDKVEYDGLGGVFGIRKNKSNEAPRIMLASHMDEVGFMVSQILENGLFRVVPLGGWNPYTVSAQRFTLQTKKGDYPIISTSVPPHLLRGANKQKGIDVADILFDAGFVSKEEAEEFGVRPGDGIVPQAETIKTANGKRLISKAWDNRYGCTLVLDVLEELYGQELPNTLIAGANVQEEVGLRGAKVSTHKFKPDLFFAVDCSPADDMSGKKDANGQLDEGFLLRIFDPGMIMLGRMREYILELAEDNNIPYQYFVSKGGTDAGAAHLVNDGVPSAVIGVPGRYIHTHQTMFSIKDYEAAREMVLKLITTLDKTEVDTIIYGK